MDEAQGLAFLKALNAKKVKVKANGWIEAACPLAIWTHKHGTDSTPSFGLSIAPGKPSFFSCFACQGGTAAVLLYTIEMHLQRMPVIGVYALATAHAILADELKVLPLPEYEQADDVYQKFVEWPQYWLDNFKPVAFVPVAVEYLTHRNVSLDIWTHFGLRYDLYRRMIVCPYFNVFGKFAGARGRGIPTSPMNHYEYSYSGVSNTKIVWYNEPVLNTDGPVVVVEGQFDCWRTMQAYPKVVANLTAKPSLQKVKKLSYSDRVIHIPDADDAGDVSVIRYQEMCSALKIPYVTLHLDPGVKDPDQCHPEYLKEKIAALL